MASITINDLDINEELDRQAQELLSGGWYRIRFRYYRRRYVRRFYRIRYRIRYRVRRYRYRVTRWRFSW